MLASRLVSAMIARRPAGLAAFSHVLGSFVDRRIEVMLFALMLALDSDDSIGDELFGLA